MYQQVLSYQSEVLGESHPGTVDTLEELADLYALQQRFDESVPLLRKAVETNWRVGRIDSKLEFKLSVTYVWLRNVDSYADLCQQMLTRYQAPTTFYMPIVPQWPTS